MPDPDPPKPNPSRKPQATLARHLPAVRAFIHRRCGSAVRRCDSVSDLVQSVCRELLQDASRLDLDSDEKLRALLLCSARRKIVDRARRYGAQRRRSNRAGSLSGEPLARAPSPSQEVLGQEMAARLDAALARLRPSDREIILLGRIERLDTAALAAHFNIQPDAAKQRLHRALAELARHLPDVATLLERKPARCQPHR